jgi:hypothetical protein
MPRFVVPFDEFDLKGLIDSTIAFWGNRHVVELQKDEVRCEAGDDVDYCSWLNGADHSVLLSFASSYVDEPVLCADGTSVDPDDDLLDPDLLNKTSFFEDAGYAYRVQRANENVVVDFVLWGELTEPVDHAGLFEQPMNDYLQRFMRK